MRGVEKGGQTAGEDGGNNMSAIPECQMFGTGLSTIAF